MRETSRDTRLPETIPREARPELAAGGLRFRIHLSGWEAVCVSCRLRARSANKGWGADGWRETNPARNRCGGGAGERAAAAVGTLQSPPPTALCPLGELREGRAACPLGEMGEGRAALRGISPASTSIRTNRIRAAAFPEERAGAVLAHTASRSLLRIPAEAHSRAMGN